MTVRLLFLPPCEEGPGCLMEKIVSYEGCSLGIKFEILISTQETQIFLIWGGIEKL